MVFQEDNNKLTSQKINKNTAISFMQLSASKITKRGFFPLHEKDEFIFLNTQK
jgi:hypothetical protein